MTHLFTGDGGALYDTRVVGWGGKPPLRPNCARHHAQIQSLADVKATLRAGPFVWPGGYTIFFMTSDGETLSFDAVKSEFGQVAWDWLNDASTGWRVVACDHADNYDPDSLICDHTGEVIE